MAKKRKTNKDDRILYACPLCGYDGSGWKNGAEGWIDATSEASQELGPCCAGCGEETDADGIPWEHFKCEKCGRHLAGDYYSAPDCNKTGRGVALCGRCSGY